MLDFNQLTFNYEPFPIGVAARVLDPGTYTRLYRSYPRPEYFRAQPQNGNRFSFSRENNVRGFWRFLRQNEEWREFYKWVKGSFRYDFLRLLAQQGIDLGVPGPEASLKERWRDYLRKLKLGRILGSRVSIRLSFSMIPVSGGFLLPHTDTPRKLANIILSMTAPDEFDPALGGGLDINRSTDPRYLFDRSNRRLQFEQVEALYTVPFHANQAIVVIRTDNSWHSVAPMRGTGSKAMRKAVNINLMSF